FAIAGAETVAAAALHRATVRGEDEAVARRVDLQTTLEVLAGKVEFESGEEGRELEILEHLLRTATAEAVRTHFRGLDLAPLVEAFGGERTVPPAGPVPPAGDPAPLPQVPEPGLCEGMAERLDAEGDAERAGAIELGLEGLFLVRRLSKESGDGESVYG